MNDGMKDDPAGQKVNYVGVDVLSNLVATRSGFDQAHMFSFCITS